MNLTTMVASTPMPLQLAILAAVVVLLLLSRSLFSVLLVGVLAVAAWNLDFAASFERIRHFAEAQVKMPLDQAQLAQFAVGLVAGLIVCSSLLFVRAFGQAALVGASLAILFVLGTEGFPALMKHAASGLQLVREFDAAAKGVALAKFVTGFFKVRQIRWRGVGPP